MKLSLNKVRTFQVVKSKDFLLQDSKGDRTTFIISQRTSTIEHCDKILVLNDGALEGVGTHEELLKNCETYKDIYESCNKEAS